MSELNFYQETHQYELDGELLPSVSEIIRFISREHYADINPVYIERAADRGTRIHKACEQLDLTGECDVDEDIEGYVEAYAAFVRDYKPKWTHIEAPMYHPRNHYAGTIDRVGLIDGKRIIVDIKSSTQPYLPAVKAQLGGYMRMLTAEDAINDPDIAMLQVKKDGSYKFSPLDIDEAWGLFECCLVLHQATQKKKRRKPNGS